MGKFTKRDVKIAQNIDSKYKYITREFNGTLKLFSEKPYGVNGSWYTSGNAKECELPLADVFEGIKFDDKKPTALADIKVDPLDEAEKRYLKGVIRPWRECVTKICKENSCFNVNQQYESIVIYYDDETGGDFMALPAFKKSSMYAGMELNVSYTPDELGI